MRRRFEALGGPPLLPSRQPEVEGPPGAPEPGLLLRRGRDTPQVRPGRAAGRHGRGQPRRARRGATPVSASSAWAEETRAPRVYLETRRERNNPSLLPPPSL